ncbi:hypothetical protein BJY04DRAFT_182618 [Aspergillus karnatakaensis]|uniref:uncharacterized protein n=1 Tax=Aspergillus karnatakaensis TaxID=1810916 RepID=UPI003CCD31DE
MTAQPDYHLLGTFTRYSSWTSRIEAILSYFEIPYTSKFIPLEDVPTHSPSALVPTLTSASLNITVTDSLAIAEFLADQNPHLPLWPRDPALRALARSAAADMHAGFATLRNTFHTNFVAMYIGDIPLSEDGRKEVKRVLEIWGRARRETASRLAEKGEEDEGFLFGGFSIADAFFWPVLWRFRTYNLPLSDASAEALAWVEKMWSDPKIRKLIHGYYRQLEDPATRITKYDQHFAEYGVRVGEFGEDWEFSREAAAHNQKADGLVGW